MSDKGFPSEEELSEIRKVHPNAFKAWSEREDQELLIYYFEREYSLDLIAKSLGRPIGAIRTRLEKLKGQRDEIEESAMAAIIFLRDGRDPLTGRSFPRDSVWSHPMISELLAEIAVELVRAPKQLTPKQGEAEAESQYEKKRFALEHAKHLATEALDKAVGQKNKLQNWLGRHINKK